MKNEANTSQNYIMLFFVAIINIFMALSLNSFSSSESFLPALFLYFISSLATFLEKVNTYEQIASRTERIISICGFTVSLFFVCGYLANALHFIDINFQKPCNTYKILIQGRPDTFFTFSSIDITYFVFACVASIPFLSILLALIPYLRNKGYTKEIISNILVRNIKICIINIIISICFGFLGVVYCHLKSLRLSSAYGTPQYTTYFFCAFFIALTVSFAILISRKRYTISK